MSKSDTKQKPASSATRADTIRAIQAARTPEARSESARKAQATRTPEQRAAIAKKSAGTRAANRAAKAKREASAAKGIATKRERYPDKYKAPPATAPAVKGRKGKATGKPPKNPNRVAGGRKAAATRKANEAQRAAAAASMKQDIERAKAGPADWSSEITYLVGQGIGGLGEWVKELFAAVVEDTAGMFPGGREGRVPPGLLAIPWRVQGSVEGASGGGSTFDLIVDGTSTDRATALIAAIVGAAERGGIMKKDEYPRRSGRPDGKGSRAAKPMNAEAEKAKAEAIAKYVEDADKERENMRITSLTAPPWSKVWGGSPVPDEPDEEPGDDEIPF